MQTHLHEKVVIVTGGGSGIGRATALAFAEEGAHVAVVDVQRAGVQAVADAIEEMGCSSVAYITDVTDPEQVRASFTGVADTFGRIDVLVNCAGVAQFAPIMELSLDDWDRVLAVNLKGTVICCQAVLPYMLLQGNGHIITIGSVAGQIGGELSGANYAASKAAVISYTKSLAKQFGPRGVIVNGISPGPIASPMTADWPQSWIDNLLASMPLERMGRPEEVAALAVFLASGLADYLHGAQININGGMYLG